MDSIPVVCFAGFSGAGKTTLIEKLIPVLSREGYRTAVIKHDAHSLSFDAAGKDSHRFTQAGAAYSIVNGPEDTAMFVRPSMDLEQSISLVSDADIILLEGYKNSGFTQFGLCRRENNEGFTAQLSQFAALITDMPVSNAPVPVFDLNDINGIAAFMIKNMDSFTRFDAGKDHRLHL